MPYSRRILHAIVVATLSGFALACAHVNPQFPESVLGKKTAETVSKVDSTDLEVGRVDFSRYTTPAACERAVENTRFIVTRGRTMIRTSYSPESDTLPTQAVEVGRACAKNFTVETTEPDQLFFLARLSLIIGDEQQAIAATIRSASLAPNAEARGEVLYKGVRMALDATPMRLQTAEFFAQLLEAQGDSAATSRLQAHHALITHYAVVFDVPKIITEASLLIENSRRLTPEEKNTFGSMVLSPFAYLALIVAFERGPLEAANFIVKSADSLSSMRSPQFKMSLNSLVQNYTKQGKFYGSVAPRLEGPMFGADSAMEHPQEGQVSLFVTVDQNCGSFCDGQYAVLNRLYQRYSAQGFEITLIAKTVGFSRLGIVEPAEETDSIRSYFLEELKMPATLLVQQTPYTIQPDGRRNNERTLFDTQYDGMSVVLIDKHRIIRWTNQGFNLTQEALLRAYVEQALSAD